MTEKIKTIESSSTKTAIRNTYIVGGKYSAPLKNAWVWLSSADKCQEHMQHRAGCGVMQGSIQRCQGPALPGGHWKEANTLLKGTRKLPTHIPARLWGNIYYHKWLVGWQGLQTHWGSLRSDLSKLWTHGAFMSTIPLPGIYPKLSVHKWRDVCAMYVWWHCE